MEVVNSYPPDAMAQTNAAGAWSVRDLLAHISSWEEEFLKAMPLILADQRLPRYSTVYGGIDAFNAQEQVRAKGMSQGDVLRRLTETHERLVAAVHSLPSMAGHPRRRERLTRRLRQDTYQHYAEHTAQLHAWREGTA